MHVAWLITTFIVHAHAHAHAHRLTWRTQWPCQLEGAGHWSPLQCLLLPPNGQSAAMQQHAIDTTGEETGKQKKKKRQRKKRRGGMTGRKRGTLISDRQRYSQSRESVRPRLFLSGCNRKTEGFKHVIKMPDESRKRQLYKHIIKLTDM